MNRKKETEQKIVAIESSDMNRIREDLNALRTALNMQAALLTDMEKTLQIHPEEPIALR